MKLDHFRQYTRMGGRFVIGSLDGFPDLSVKFLGRQGGTSGGRNDKNSCVKLALAKDNCCIFFDVISLEVGQDNLPKYIFGHVEATSDRKFHRYWVGLFSVDLP
jgi:hypothetical protein